MSKKHPHSNKKIIKITLKSTFNYLNSSLFAPEAKLNSFFICFPCSLVWTIIYCQFELQNITHICNVKNFCCYLSCMNRLKELKAFRHVKTGWVLFSQLWKKTFTLILTVLILRMLKSIFAAHTLLWTTASWKVLYLINHCNSLLKLMMLWSKLCNKIHD